MNNNCRANIALRLSRLAKEMWRLSDRSLLLTCSERAAIMAALNDLENVIRADDDLART